MIALFGEELWPFRETQPFAGMSIDGSRKGANTSMNKRDLGIFEFLIHSNFYHVITTIWGSPFLSKTNNKNSLMTINLKT